MLLRDNFMLINFSGRKAEGGLHSPANVGLEHNNGAGIWRGCHGKDNDSLMISFMVTGGKEKTGLTALVALDHDVFDSQQATLP